MRIWKDGKTLRGLTNAGYGISLNVQHTDRLGPIQRGAETQ